MICKEILQYFNLRGLEPLEELCALTKLHPKLSVIDGEGIPLAWSEYSIYTIVGEWFGSLFERHLTADDVAVTGVRLHSNRNVWSEADLGRLKSDPSDSGHFLVVQSWSGISIEEIVSRLDLPI
jgi:hypothetical protein